MLTGVIVGVVAGVLLVPLLGTNPLEVTLVIAIAMLATAVLTEGVISLIQGGASVAIIVSLQSSTSGSERLIDALIGAAVALLVSQVLFSPSPRKLLADAGREALRPISAGLRARARALANGDAATALEYLREGESSVTDLAETQETSRYVASRTLRGRWERDQRFESLDLRFGEVDLLFGSTLLLARAEHRLLDDLTVAPEWLRRAVDELACGAEALAEEPESPNPRRRASDLALEAMQAGDSGVVDANLCIALVADQARLAAADLARVATPPEDGR